VTACTGWKERLRAVAIYHSNSRSWRRETEEIKKLVLFSCRSKRELTTFKTTIQSKKQTKIRS